MPCKVVKCKVQFLVAEHIPGKKVFLLQAFNDKFYNLQSSVKEDCLKEVVSSCVLGAKAL